MNFRIFISLFVLCFLLMGFAGKVSAHGNPVVTLEENAVAPGGMLSIKGSKMHPGAMCTFALESMEGSTPLGKTKIDKKGVFSAQISLPKNISPGSHRVRVATKGGEGIFLSLTVVPRPTLKTEVPVQTRQISNESKQSTMRTLDDASPSEGNNSVIIRSNGRAEDILTAQIPTNEMLRLDRTKSPLESAGAIVLSFASLALGMLLLRRGGSSDKEAH